MALTKLNFGGNQQALVAANIPTLTNTQLPTTIDHSKMPTDSIIQVQHVKTNTKTTVTSSTMADVTNLTLSFTPRLASSTLKVTALVAFKNQRTSANYAGGSYMIVHDGTAIDSTPAEYEHFNQFTGGSVTEANNYSRSTKVGFVAAGNTNARTIKVQLRSYSSSNVSINWTGSFYSYLVVEEIKS
tara:strand:+ start:815 stop:1372 length:558 start_codon:yes stop_codon:yes gene_type:complete